MNESRKLYIELSKLFTDIGISGNNFSKLEKLFHLADKKCECSKGVINPPTATTVQQVPSGINVDIVKLVQGDLENRALIGEKKYGERLRPFNNRCAMTDAYQEALDLCNYLRQALYEKYGK